MAACKQNQEIEEMKERVIFSLHVTGTKAFVGRLMI